MMRVCLMDLFAPCRALDLVRRNVKLTYFADAAPSKLGERLVGFLLSIVVSPAKFRIWEIVQ